MSQLVMEADLDLEEDIENEEEGYSPEQEKNIRVFASKFLGDVKASIRQYLDQFFKDKPLHCGGKIPSKLLYSERRISMCLNLDISRGVDKAYECIAKMEDFNETDKFEGESSYDIKLVAETLNLIARSGIPQQYAAGFMLLYLEFVEGINIES